jgi:hypothetical protein
MSAALVLPYVWAYGRSQAVLKAPTPEPDPAEPRLAFYRKYTEALLRRYVRMSMEAGKVPSLLKQDMFRGKVSSYRIGNFDDMVIFIADVDRCLHKLDTEDQELIEHLAMHAYSLLETAEMLHMPLRTTIRRYGIALDRLTRILVDVQLLRTPNCVKR